MLQLQFRRFFLQRFNNDFKEFVDIENYEEVKKGDKIVFLAKTAAAPPKVAIEEVSQEEQEATVPRNPTASQRTITFKGNKIALGPALQTASTARSSLSQTLKIDSEKIKTQIYQLKSDDKLYEYHKAINEAAFTLVMDDPSILCSKAELQRRARVKLHEEGFSYKKKESRSKTFGTASREHPRRENLSQNIRQKRVQQLREDLREVDLQLDFALKQREKCANVNQFSKALDVSKEMDDLRLKKGSIKRRYLYYKKKEKLIKRVKKCKEKQNVTGTSKQINLLKFVCKSSVTSDKAVSPESCQQNTLMGSAQSAGNVKGEPDTDTNQNHTKDDVTEKDERCETLQASQNVNPENTVNDTDLVTHLQPMASLEPMITQGNTEQDKLSVNSENF